MGRRIARTLRGAEITLWVIGLSLLGVSLGATAQRASYQHDQEQALARVISASAAAPPAASVVSSGEDDATVAEATAAVTHSEPVADIPVEQESVSATPQPRVTVSPVVLDADVMGKIEVPRIGLSAIVVEGDGDESLDRAVGWLPDTSRPGESGNAAFAAHRDTFFRPLEKLASDDTIRLVTPSQTLEYRVSSMRVVEPTDVSVLEPSSEEEITLITCYPFRYVGPAPQRFIVKATRLR